MTGVGPRLRALVERFSPAQARMSLKTRTLITIAIMMAAIFAAADVMELRYDHADRVKLLEGRAQALTSIIADALAQPLWNLSDDQIGQTLAAAMHDPDFEAIEVRGNDGRVLAARRMPSRSANAVRARDTSSATSPSGCPRPESRRPTTTRFGTA
jgi:hypothetical protein